MQTGCPHSSDSPVSGFNAFKVSNDLKVVKVIKVADRGDIRQNFNALNLRSICSKRSVGAVRMFSKRILRDPPAKLRRL